jgi:hypothetical protein
MNLHYTSSLAPVSAQKSLEVNGSQRHDCLQQGNDTTVNPEVYNVLDKRERYIEFIGSLLRLSIENQSRGTRL